MPLETVQLISTLVLTASAALGAITAFVGLSAWRQQLRGQSEYELARRFLRAAFALRDEVESFRSPMILAGETQAAAESLGVEVDASAEGSSRLARHVRWQRVQKTFSDLRLEQVEAEVLWGDQVADWVAPIEAEIRALWVAMVEYDDSAERSVADRRRRVELRRIINGNGSDSDQFWPSFKSAIDGLEGRLRKHISR